MFPSQKITKLQRVHFQSFLPIYQDGAGWLKCREIAVNFMLWKTFDKIYQKLFASLPLLVPQYPKRTGPQGTKNYPGGWPGVNSCGFSDRFVRVSNEQPYPGYKPDGHMRSNRT